MTRKTDSGKTYTEVFPYSTEFSQGLKVKAVVNKGESYVYSDGKWSDMKDKTDALKEQAQKQIKDEFGGRKTNTAIKLESKDTFAVDNYPIKGISVST